MAVTILIADDDADIRLALELLLGSAGYRVLSASDTDAVMAALVHKPALVLLDMNFRQDTTSGQEGLTLLAKLKDSGIPVIMMTAWGSVELAVTAMQQGAAFFIQKPWNNQALLQQIKQQLTLSALQTENQQLRELTQASNDNWVAVSPAMQQLEQVIQTIAGTEANVLILGENGTGKSALAQRVHQLSARNKQAFISVNMAAIPESLFEAELFGHEKGAFTDARKQRVGRFALAHQGSLFLDEIGCLPLHLQPKLLRVLESGEFEALGSSASQRSDARIISATNADLTTLLQQGQFRQDLLYRLNTLVLTLPPLRQRLADIPLLTAQICQRLCHKYRKDPVQFTAAAQHALQQYQWPGNVRELHHVLERAVLLSQSPLLDVGQLQLPLTQLNSAKNCPLDLAAMEQQLIQQALTLSGQQLTQAAELLGISRHALARRLEKYQMPLPE